MCRFDRVKLLRHTNEVERPREILEMILGHLGFVFEITEREEKEGVFLEVHTRDPRRLIGREGRVLEELQFLVNRLASQGEDERERIIIDVEGYREQAKQELIERVKRVKERVLETEKSFSLEPMNSYQRRLVHQAFQNDPDIKIVSPESNSRFKSMIVELRRSEKET